MRFWVRRDTPFSIRSDLYDVRYEKIAEYEVELPDEQVSEGWIVTVRESMLAIAPMNPEVEQAIYREF
jgi:hypothetical protein